MILIGLPENSLERRFIPIVDLVKAVLLELQIMMVGSECVICLYSTDQEKTEKEI